MSSPLPRRHCGLRSRPKQSLSKYQNTIGLKASNKNIIKIIATILPLFPSYIVWGYDVPFGLEAKKTEKEAHCDGKGVLDVFE